MSEHPSLGSLLLPRPGIGATRAQRNSRELRSSASKGSFFFGLLRASSACFATGPSRAASATRAGRGGRLLGRVAISAEALPTSAERLVQRHGLRGQVGVARRERGLGGEL